MFCQMSPLQVTVHSLQDPECLRNFKSWGQKGSDNHENYCWPLSCLIPWAHLNSDLDDGHLPFCRRVVPNMKEIRLECYSCYGGLRRRISAWKQQPHNLNPLGCSLKRARKGPRSGHHRSLGYLVCTGRCQNLGRLWDVTLFTVSPVGCLSSYRRFC